MIRMILNLITQWRQKKRKKLFFAFAENEIPILMQKEIEPSLEDIFLKLTDNTTEKEENINESDI